MLQAWDEFKKDKRNKLDVQQFEFRLEDNLFALQCEIATRTYQHGEYYPFRIRDPKPRLIHKALVRDRIVHHLLFRALEPIFEPTFIHHSYSCRRDKGTHKGVAALATMARATQQRYGKCFALKCDIAKFFHSIDHTILIDIISKKVVDADVLWLIRAVVNSFSTNHNPAGFARERE